MNYTDDLLSDIYSAIDKSMELVHLGIQGAGAILLVEIGVLFLTIIFFLYIWGRVERRFKTLENIVTNIYGMQYSMKGQLNDNGKKYPSPPEIVESIS